jgi:hypothetical protein
LPFSLEFSYFIFFSLLLFADFIYS